MCSAAALTVLGLGWAEPELTQVLFLAGVAGSLLPDLDADSSRPVRGFFALLGVLFAILAGFSLAGRLSVLALLLICAGGFLAVRYLLCELFARYTVHRGLFHSLLAAGFVGLAAVNGAFHLVGLCGLESWLVGSFVLLGYLTHLLLDEASSVDLLSNRVKRSFGTAVKPFSGAAPRASALMFLGAAGLVFMAPTLDPILAIAEGRAVSC